MCLIPGALGAWQTLPGSQTGCKQLCIQSCFQSRFQSRSGPCEESRRGDSRCVCPSAGSPPGSGGADVIQQLFWQALSSQRVPRGRLDTLPLQPPPASLRSSAGGELRDGSEGSKAGEEGILLLTPFCRVFLGRKESGFIV